MTVKTSQVLRPKTSTTCLHGFTPTSGKETHKRGLLATAPKPPFCNSTPPFSGLPCPGNVRRQNTHTDHPCQARLPACLLTHRRFFCPKAARQRGVMVVGGRGAWRSKLRRPSADPEGFASSLLIKLANKPNLILSLSILKANPCSIRSTPSTRTPGWR